MTGELGQFLEHLVQLLVAAAQLVQRIQEALLILDHVPCVGCHVLAREAPAYVLAEHGQPFQLRGHGVVGLFPFRGRFRLTHPFHEFFTGVLEVPSQGLEVGPSGEVADAVLAGAPHGFVHALQHLLKALLQALGRVADGWVVRRGFQVIAQEVDHLVGDILNHLGHLAMLGLEVLEAEAQGARLHQLGPRDGVVVQHFEMVDDDVAFLQANAVQIPDERFLQGTHNLVTPYRDALLPFADGRHQGNLAEPVVVAGAILQGKPLVAVHFQVFRRLEHLHQREAVGHGHHLVRYRQVLEAEGVLEADAVSLRTKQDDAALSVVSGDLQRDLPAVVQGRHRVRHALVGGGGEAQGRAFHAADIAAGEGLVGKAGVVGRVERHLQVGNGWPVHRGDGVPGRLERPGHHLVKKVLGHFGQDGRVAAGLGQVHGGGLRFLGRLFRSCRLVYEPHRVRTGPGGSGFDGNGGAADHPHVPGHHVDEDVGRRQVLQGMRHQCQGPPGEVREQDGQGQNRRGRQRQQPCLDPERPDIHQGRGFHAADLLAGLADQREDHGGGSAGRPGRVGDLRVELQRVDEIVAKFRPLPLDGPGRPGQAAGSQETNERDARHRQHGDDGKHAERQRGVGKELLDHVNGHAQGRQHRQRGAGEAQRLQALDPPQPVHEPSQEVVNRTVVFFVQWRLPA